MRQSRYSILIICEGENTEPLFFNSIRDEILKRTYEVDATIDIIKEPNVNQENDSEELAFHSPHKKKRKPKELRKAIKKNRQAKWCLLKANMYLHVIQPIELFCFHSSCKIIRFILKSWAKRTDKPE